MGNIVKSHYSKIFVLNREAVIFILILSYQLINFGHAIRQLAKASAILISR